MIAPPEKLIVLLSTLNPLSPEPDASVRIRFPALMANDRPSVLVAEREMYCPEASDALTVPLLSES